MRTGIIVCSRFNSRRLAAKALLKLNGKPILWHLFDRLLKFNLPVVLAIPTQDEKYFAKTIERYESNENFFYYLGSAEDPLERMASVAYHMDFDHVIRVTHDKVFIEERYVTMLLNRYMERGLDYAYSSSLPPGAGFEIISNHILQKATDEYKNVEHISYAIKSLTDNKMDFQIPMPSNESRFLIDFEEDFTFMQTLFACLGNDCGLLEAIEFCNKNPWINNLNKLPKFTIYTCAYNAEKTLEDTIQSVTMQDAFNQCEYIIIDDFSTDQTPYIAAKAASENPNIRYIRNDKNLGLAASSNVALANARGEFIVRLDADDYFTKVNSIILLHKEITDRGLDVCYPGFYDGSLSKVGAPEDNHHAGGALFRARALNHIKFTEKLRNYEGLDLYLRARKQLFIGYLKTPCFFYRHTEGSMSRSNLEQREKVKAEIEATNGL